MIYMLETHTFIRKQQNSVRDGKKGQIKYLIFFFLIDITDNNNNRHNVFSKDSLWVSKMNDSYVAMDLGQELVILSFKFALPVKWCNII